MVYENVRQQPSVPVGPPPGKSQPDRLPHHHAGQSRFRIALGWPFGGGVGVRLGGVGRAWRKRTDKSNLAGVVEPDCLRVDDADNMACGGPGSSTQSGPIVIASSANTGAMKASSAIAIV